MVTMVGDNIIELRRLFTDYQAFDKKLLLRFEMRLANSRFTAFSSPPAGAGSVPRVVELVGGWLVS